MTPDDPLYTSQEHFSLIGDIETIWDEYSGEGVSVGVYDDGIDYTHEDLNDNYDSSLEVVDENGNVIDPFPALFEPDGDGHGTSVAGLIAAENNNKGGVGVAWGASITGVIIFDPDSYGDVNGDPEEFYFVVAQATQFDISSNSWGATPFYTDGLASDGFAEGLEEIYDANSQNGRDGLGTIITQAAGNDNMDANGDGVNVSRFTITVAATDMNGDAAYYSNFGASILITAPAAEVTTDLTGTAGYDPTNYTDEFGGTSAATPVTSGVIALMLDANPELGWRDVQNILAASATLTGSEYDATSKGVEEEGLWYSNNSDDWNGGGYHTHTNYGYGMINVYNAVRMAEVWTLFDDAQVSDNELTAKSGLNNFADMTLADNNRTGKNISFTITKDIEVEHVELTLDMDSQAIGDLLITLTSADGTEVVVALNNPKISGRIDVNGNWVYAIDGLRGELSAGTWTVNVADVRSGNRTTLNSASIEVFGAQKSTNDVHHITDEFLAMLGFESARGTISDTNGGIDWLNMAAVAGNVLLDLWDGGGFMVDGVEWADIKGLIENVATGDGNDKINGGENANKVYGERGNDLIKGGGGNDILHGGQGKDQLNGGAGNDILYGELGTDTLIGAKGNDTFIVDADDLVSENANSGTDTVKSKVDFTLGANVENLILLGTTDLDGKGNALNNKVQGNEGDNILTGGQGNDTLIGNGGADTLIGGAGKDILTGGAGADTFRFIGSLDSSNIDKIHDFNVAADTIQLDDATFTALDLGQLSKGEFRVNTTGLAADASDRMIYEKDTGELYYDRDGSGSAAGVKIANMDTYLALTSADFFVI